MAYSPQDVYARHLVSRRGYLLWTPEPNMNLPDVYIQQGLKIGDVGVVVPEDGSFDVFFNLCLPPTHSLHRETGVPNNFTPILLSGRDIAKYPEAESAGRIISTSSMVRVRDKGAPDEDPERPAQSGPLNYEFTLSSQEGAALILPEGAERYYLRNERLFMDQATRHALDWYNFAEQRLGRIISYDSLYLITGFYKARSWSLAAYQQGAGAGEASAQFKAVQVGLGNIATSYTWETTHAMDWRVGPSDQYYHGFANQTVFIQGFKIAVREGILGRKRITVKADFPSVRTYHISYPKDSRFSHLWGGGSRSSSGSISSAQASKGTTSSCSVEVTEGGLSDVDVGDDMDEDVTIEKFPHVAKPFHPCDIINQYLLQEVPSATVAVTHDNQWITLINRGLLNLNELPQAERLVEAVKDNYSTAFADEDVVYLQSTLTNNSDEGQEMITPTSSGEIMDLFSIPHDMPTPEWSDIDAQHSIPMGSTEPLAKSSQSSQVLATVGEHADFGRILAPDEAIAEQPAIKVTYPVLPSKRPPCTEKSGRYDNTSMSTTACSNCKVRQIKCDRALPDCASCVRRGSSCTYVGDIEGKGRETDRSILTQVSTENVPSVQQNPVIQRTTSLGFGDPSQITTSCIECRANSIKCSRAHPTCARCAQLSVQCIYDGDVKTRLEQPTQPSRPGLAGKKKRGRGAKVSIAPPPTSKLYPPTVQSSPGKGTRQPTPTSVQDNVGPTTVYTWTHGEGEPQGTEHLKAGTVMNASIAEDASKTRSALGQGKRESEISRRETTDKLAAQSQALPRYPNTLEGGKVDRTLFDGVRKKAMTPEEPPVKPEPQQPDIPDILLNLPHDITGHVTRANKSPFGSGSVGDVYKGMFTTEGKSTGAAIKVYKVFLQQDERLAEKRKRIHSEIMLWFELQHLNVLPLLGFIRDADIHPEIPTLVYPWAKNGTLSGYLQRNEDLTLTTRLILIMDVARGLQYLHSKRMIHGDLSGSNVLVHANGRACISDFGMFALLTSLYGPSVSGGWVLREAVRWMDPDILNLKNAQPWSPTTQSDVYSFGSIMLQTLTSNIPYHHLSRVTQVLFAMMKGTKPEPDRPVQNALTDDRWKFIQRCWSGDGKRPSSDEIVEFTKREPAEDTRKYLESGKAAGAPGEHGSQGHVGNWVEAAEC